MSVTGGETTDDSGATDGGVDDGHDIGELGFKDRVEVCRRSESCETVGVGELGEDTNVGRVFKLSTDGHADKVLKWVSVAVLVVVVVKVIEMRKGAECGNGNGFVVEYLCC